jgi:hypothetical protein
MTIANYVYLLGKSHYTHSLRTCQLQSWYQLSRNKKVLGTSGNWIMTIAYTASQFIDLQHCCWYFTLHGPYSWGRKKYHTSCDNFNACVCAKFELRLAAEDAGPGTWRVRRVVPDVSKAQRPFEISITTCMTWCHIPEDLHLYIFLHCLLLDDVDGCTGSLHLGPYIRALCAPHWNSFLPSSREALCTHRRERPLLAREGNENLASSPQFAAEAGIFDMPQSWDMGQIILLPLWRKACWGFFHIGKNPTALVGIELGNQRPAC